MNPADEHGRIDELLPWYANGSLDAAVRARIAAHLERCETCREELTFLGDVRQVLRQSVAAEQKAVKTPSGGFESLPAELRQRVRTAAASRADRSRWLIPAIAAALFSAVGLGVALTVTQLDAPRFRTATSGMPAAADQLRVTIRFAPEAEFNRVNELLRRHRAVIVQGPDEYDQWILEIPVASDAHRQQLLATLKGTTGIEEARLAGSQSATE